jgi:hypothetical protein
MEWIGRGKGKGARAFDIGTVINGFCGRQRELHMQEGGSVCLA